MPVAVFFISTAGITTPLQSFAAGFIAVFLLWGGYCYYINFETEFILAPKISSLFNMEGIYFSILITGLVGAVTGGFAALSGRLFTALFR